MVSAALGAVALTGTWTGKVVSERETLVGQIKTSGSGTPAQQISEIYGDAWHSTALVNGVFALLALIVAVTVLLLPGAPPGSAPSPPRAPSWAASASSCRSAPTSTCSCPSRPRAPESARLLTGSAR